MKKSEAKVGVRVRVKGDSIGEMCNAKWKGLTGTIRCILGGAFYPVGVEFDKIPNPPICFHSLEGNCKIGYGRWGYLREFEVIKIKKKRVAK